MTLEEMSKVDPRTVDRKSLVQRSSVKISAGKNKKERVLDFISQIKNPYCYLEGKTVVKVGFSGGARTIEDCVCAYLNGA